MDGGTKLMEWSRQLCDPNIDIEQTKAIYNQWAPRYEEDIKFENSNIHNGESAAMQLDRALDGRKDAKILDLATGTGQVAEQLVSRGHCYIDGIDASTGMMDIAKAKKVHVNLIEAVIGPHGIPIPTHTYDAAVGSLCFGPGHLQCDCFDEIIRVIKPGGLMVMMIRAVDMEDFDAAIKRLVKNGKWKMLQKNLVDEKYFRGPAFIFTFEIC